MERFATHMVSEDCVTEELIGERRLWTAVITNAVEDWLSGPLRTRRSAQQFLFENENDFQQVCACAGLDPSSLRAKLMRIGRRIEMSGPHEHPMAA